MTDTPTRPPIYGPKILSIGRAGRGKSYSCGTILNVPDMELVYIYSDPGGIDSVYDCAETIGADKSRIHGKYIQVGVSNFKALAAISSKINRGTYQSLCTMNELDKKVYNQMEKIYEHYNDLTTDDGLHIGDVTKMDPFKYMLVHDGLTHLSIAARDNTIGAKPSLHEGEWNMAMNQVERFITTFCAAIPAMAVMIAHVENENDMITGKRTIMCSTLGSKLAPKIPGLGFSDVVYNVYDDSGFLWSTKEMSVDTKNRILPLSSKIIPDYAALYLKWLNLRGYKR